MNDKRAKRMWRLHGLRVPAKKRLTGIGVHTGAMSPIRPNVLWALDFQLDTTLEDIERDHEFTHEAVAIDVHRRLDADGLVRALDRFATTTDRPLEPPSPGAVQVKLPASS